MRLYLDRIKALLPTELAGYTLINTHSLMIAKILLQYLDSTS